MNAFPDALGKIKVLIRNHERKLHEEQVKHGFIHAGYGANRCNICAGRYLFVALVIFQKI